MISTICHRGSIVHVDLTKPIDISIPLEAGPGHPLAWYVDPIRIEPVMTDRFVGSVADGGDVNFRNIHFNPHGHGTHTECVGHISPEVHSINKALTEFFFMARLITIEPDTCEKDEEWTKPGDKVITRNQLEARLGGVVPESVIIRTTPNSESKLGQDYSNTNPAYLDVDAATYLREKSVQHLLIDLPSIDREEDGGHLKSHHAFWNFPDDPRFNATITEFIFVPDSIEDGDYILNLHVAPFENDASPSRPVLFKITQ